MTSNSSLARIATTHKTPKEEVYQKLSCADLGSDFFPESDFPMLCDLAGGFPKCCTEPDVSYDDSPPAATRVVELKRACNADFIVG